MLYCISCGKRVLDDARLCGHCGAKLFDQSPSPVAAAPPPIPQRPEPANVEHPVPLPGETDLDTPSYLPDAVASPHRLGIAAGLILLSITAVLGWTLYHFMLRTAPAPDVSTASPSTIVAAQASSTSIPDSPETEDEKILYSMGLHMGKNLADLRLNEAELNMLMEGMTDTVLKNRGKVSLDTYGPKIQAYALKRAAAVPKTDAQPSAQVQSGFKARFECSMMGQPTALVTCLHMSSISVVTDSGVREFNVMTLPGGGASTFLDVDLPAHFKIRAPNGSSLPLSLRLTVRDPSGRVVFSDAASPGRSVNLEN